MPCDKCDDARCMKGKCAHFKEVKAQPRDRTALGALCGHSAHGLPLIIGTPIYISGQNQHSLCRCFQFVLRVFGVSSLSDIPELREELASFVTDLESSNIVMGPYAENI